LDGIESRKTLSMTDKELVQKLQSNGYEDCIHETHVTVKDIPDEPANRVEGTALDPRVYRWRKEAEEAGNPLAGFLEIPVDLIRDLPAYPSREVHEAIVSVEEKNICTRHGEIPIYLIKPEHGREEKPILLYYHGGAFMAGCTEVALPFCKLLAEKADAVVIGVDYHLSPEYCFPIGLEDCYDAMIWAYENAEDIGGSRAQIAVCGDSAGGTLALGVCMMDKGAKVSYEALIYPAVLVDAQRLPDYKWRLSMYEINDEDIPAMGAAVSLKALTSQMGMIYTGSNEPVTNPLAAPLLADNLSYLPKTLITLCEFDYLRLQGEAFSRKLEREGVEHRTILYKGMDHEYIDRMGYCPQAYDTVLEIARDLAELPNSKEIIKNNNN